MFLANSSYAVSMYVLYYIRMTQRQMVFKRSSFVRQPTFYVKATTQLDYESGESGVVLPV